MSKRKKLLFAIIPLLLILTAQVYFLLSYDHFKAEGGIKIEFFMDPNDVPKKYARETLEYDHIMQDAVRNHKANGGDFLTILAESNKKRGTRSLVHLLNYKEIDELSLESTDDEVIDFLRQHVDLSLSASGTFFEKRIQSAIGKFAEAKYDSKRLTVTLTIPGQRDSLDVEDFKLPHINLGFYECYEFMQLGNAWNSACILSEPDSIPETEWKLTDLNKANVPTHQSLATTVQLVYKSLAHVKKQDREYVERTLRSPEIIELFPENLRFMWSKTTDRSDQGEVWGLYMVKIPDNGKPIITNEDILRADIDFDEIQGDSVLSIRMTPEGTEKWAEMTSANINRMIAMTVNGVVYSAPNVVNAILEGVTQISGVWSKDYEDLELVLNAKALDILPIDSSTTFEKANPPILNATIQKILLGISILLIIIVLIRFFGSRKEVVAH